MISFKSRLHQINNFRLDILALSSFAVILIFAARELIGKPIMAAGDLSAYPQSLDKFILFLTSSWVPVVHGTSISVIDPIMAVRLFFFLIAFGNAGLAQLLFQFFPYFLAFSGMYFFIKLMKVGRTTRYITALLYATSPYATISIIGVGWIYGMAFYPILTLILFRLASDNRRFRLKIRNILLFTGLFVLATSFSQAVPIFMGPIILFSLFKAISQSGIKKGFFNFGYILIGIGLAFWLYGVSYYSLAGYHASYILPGGMSEVQSLGISYSYAGGLSTIANIIAAQPVGVFGWGTNSLVLVSGLLLPIFAFSGLASKKTNGTTLFFAILSMVSILWIYLSTLGQTIDLFIIFRFLVLLPNEGIVVLFLFFCYMPLFAIFMESTINIFKKIRIKLLYIVIVVILLMVPAWPFFTGHMGLLDLREDYYTYGLFIPPKYYEIQDWIDQSSGQDEFARILWLPSNYGDVQLKGKYLFNLLDFPFGGDRFSIPQMALLEQDVLKYIFENENNQHMGTLLAFFNVRYIVLDLESNDIGKPKISEYWVRGDPQLILGMLEEQDEFTLVENTSQYLIYENTKYIPNLESFERLSIIESTQMENDQAVLMLDSLASIPGFDIRNTMILYNPIDTLQENQTLENQANIIMRTKSNRNLNQHTPNELIFFSDLANIIPSLSSKRDINVMEDGLYKFTINNIGILPTVFVNMEQITLTEINDIWYQSETFNLKKGTNTLDITFPGNDEDEEEDIEIPPEDIERKNFMNLLGWWQFLEGQGSIIYDKSANGNNIDVAKSDWQIGMFGNTLDFNENYGTMTLNNIPEGTTGITFQSWIEFDQENTAKTVFYLPLTNQSNNGLLFRITGATPEIQLFSGLENKQFNFPDIIGGYPEHIAITLDGNMIKFFYNGEQTFEIDWNMTLDFDFSSFVIGMREETFPQFYQGSIYEFKIYNLALNPTDIKEEYEELKVFFAEPIIQSKPDPIVEHNFLVEPEISLFGQISSADQEFPIFGILDSPISSLTMLSETATTRHFIVNSTGPTWINLGEPFHPEWRAYLDNGDELMHTSSFGGGNAYYLNNNGITEIILSYEGQVERNILTALLLPSWSALIIGIVFFHFYPRYFNRR